MQDTSARVDVADLKLAKFFPSQAVIQQHRQKRPVAFSFKRGRVGRIEQHARSMVA